MAYFPDAALDKSLEYIATATRVSYCTSEPANYAGIAAVSLGSKTLTAGTFTSGHAGSATSGSFTIADGDTSGRKVTVAAQTSISVTGDGAGADSTITYQSFDDGTTMLATVPLTSQLIATGQTWTCPATKIIEIRDPSFS